MMNKKFICLPLIIFLLNALDNTALNFLSNNQRIFNNIQTKQNQKILQDIPKTDTASMQEYGYPEGQDTKRPIRLNMFLTKDIFTTFLAAVQDQEQANFIKLFLGQRLPYVYRDE